VTYARTCWSGTASRVVLFSIIITLAMLLWSPAGVRAQDRPEDQGLKQPAAEPENQALKQPAAEPEDQGQKPPPADGDQGSQPDAAQEHYLFGEYGRWVQFMQNKLLEMDLWGSTLTIPEGFGVVMFGWGTMRAFKRFDQNRKLIDIIPVLKIPDPFSKPTPIGDFFKFDFGISGKMAGYAGGVMYGVTDRLTVGVNTMFATVEIKMDPIFDPGSCEKLGVATLDEFLTLLNQLGRPTPKREYKSDGVDWGDTDVNATYNYFRNKWFSGGFTGRVYLPTAHIAKPDQSIIFGLGPDLDIGTGAWGAGFSKMVDFRPPKPADIVSFSLGGEGAYFFQTKRKSPHFLQPNRDVWDYMSAQGVQLDFFPDLSDMDRYYYYTPPPWVAASAGFGIGPVSVTYRHGWGFEGKYETNSPGFKKVIDSIGLVGTGDDGKLVFAAGVPLTPLYIPGLAQLRFEYQTDGRNTLVFRDRYQIGAGFVIPINPPARYRMGGGK